MKKLRLLLITLCVSVLMGSMAVTAYAGGGEEWDGLDPVEPLPTETVDPGEGFTEDGNLATRDLLYDKATNKQFITVQTSGGFHLFPDRTGPVGIVRRRPQLIVRRLPFHQWPRVGQMPTRQK